VIVVDARADRWAVGYAHHSSFSGWREDIIRVWAKTVETLEWSTTRPDYQIDIARIHYYKHPPAGTADRYHR